MLTKEFLQQIRQAAFGPFFHEEISRIFRQDAADGKYGNEEEEYRDAIKELREKLPEEKLALLDEYEAVCQQIREFSAEHGFTAGIYCGFKQLFTADNAIDGGFQHYVVDEISSMPNMQKYADLYGKTERRNELYAQMEADAAEEICQKAVVLSCYWSQAAHSASLNAFYCGYRAAMSISDQTALLENNYRTRIVKQLAMEHTLGYIESFEEQERRRERKLKAAQE